MVCSTTPCLALTVPCHAPAGASTTVRHAGHTRSQIGANCCTLLCHGHCDHSSIGLALNTIKTLSRLLSEWPQDFPASELSADDNESWMEVTPEHLEVLLQSSSLSSTEMPHLAWKAMLASRAASGSPGMPTGEVVVTGDTRGHTGDTQGAYRGHTRDLQGTQGGLSSCIDVGRTRGRDAEFVRVDEWHGRHCIGPRWGQVLRFAHKAQGR